MEIFTAGTDDNDRRLDRVLRRLLPGLPLSAVYSALRKKRVLLNGKKALGSERVRRGDRIGIEAGLLDALGPLPEYHRSGAGKIHVLLETNSILAINKPAGIAVHGPSSLAESVSALLAGQLKDSLSFRPGPLHRLDKNTTGLLFFGKTLEGARRFSTLLGGRRSAKYYLALLEGNIRGNTRWNGSVDGKEALSLVFPLAVSAEHTLACIRIVTGRKHQIRIQASGEGHPLLGDLLYGGKKDPGGYLLHSYAFILPEMDTLLGFRECRAPLPVGSDNRLTRFFGPGGKEKALAVLEEILKDT